MQTALQTAATVPPTLVPPQQTSRWLRRLPVLALLGLLGGTAAQAQVVRTLPGDYPSLAAAITDLNTNGVPAGGVTVNIAAGYTETAANLLLTATGTNANPIVFQKAGTGANPLLTAGVGTSATLDFVLGVAGSDYVTFDGISISESAANTTATTQMEFGYALFRASATDGAQFNVIKNAVVTLNKTNANSIGIYGANSLATATAALTVTAASGINSNNKVFGNVVTNAATGIQFSGSSAAGFLDADNEIGVTAGNTVGNFGSSASAWGVGGSNQISFRISGNTINSTLNYTSATASTPVAASTVTSTLRGIYTPSGTSANIDITNNQVTVASGATTSQLSGIENGAGATAANNTINITGNTVALSYTTATTATVNGIYNSATSATVNMTGNSLSATLSNTGTTSLYYNNTSAAVTNVQNNQITSVNRTGTSGSVYGYYNNASGTGTQTVSNNTFGNVTVAGSSIYYGIYSTTAASETQVRTGNTVSNVVGGTGTIYGLYTTYGSTTSQFNGNTVSNISSGGTIYGLYFANTGFSGYAAYSNTVSGLATTGTSSTIYGIYTSPTTATVYRNKVYDLSGTGTGVTIYGIYTAGGTTVTIHNNLVGDLRAPAATGLNALAGLFLSSGTTINVYFNTVYLNATSTGATFGTSGIYFSGTPTTVDLRNNVVVNKSTAAGTGGYTAALRRAAGTAGTVPTNLGSSSNNNLYYAGAPSATNVIYVEGTTATVTNPQQTIVTYKAFAAPRETVSVTEDVAFLSTTGSNAGFLHVNTTTPTQIEAGGTPISGITTDFDGDTRNTTTPDMGADEGSFTPQDLSGPTIAYTALGNTNSTANRTLTATITDASGIGTGANAPRLYYRKNSGAYSFVNPTSVSGNDYTFTFDFAAIGGVAGFDVVQYYVAAQDNAPAQNVSSVPVGATGNNPPGTAFTGTPNQFFVQGALSGTYYVGAGTSPDPTRTYPTLTAAAAAYNNNNLGGAVTFALLDATYGTNETFPVTFNANADASATNTLTIKPNTGVTASITGSSSAGAVLQFNGTDYVTVDGSANGTTTRNLTLTSANTGSSAVVWVGSLGDAAGATNITLQNLNVVGGSVTSSTAFGIYAAGTTLSATGTGGDNDNLVIQNNAISSAYEAIYARGTSTGLLNGLQITGNQLGGSTATTTVTYRGIDVLAAAAPQISQNRVVGMQTTASISIAAIDLGSNVANAVVSRNYISNLRSTSTSGYGAYGVSISSTTGTTGNEISNNMISDIITDGDGSSTTFNPFGIRLAGGTGTKVYYNSVNLTGAFTTVTTSDLSAALLVTTSSVTGLDLRNNVLANTLTGGAGTKSYALYATVAASFGTINYNDYYVSGGNAVLAYVAADKATLADLRTTTTQDANSVSVNPGFVSAADLHTTSFDLNNVGTPVSVTVDYDGEARSATTPDLGADEFALPQTADLTPTALVGPAASNSCYSPAEPVVVTIRTVGSAAIDFSTAPATVTVVVTPPSGPAQTFTTTLNTGTLASGATQNVTLPGTLDMTAPGTYSFAVTATVTGDATPANDVLTPAPTRTVTAPAAGTLASSTTAICVSGTAALTLTGSANGSIQVQQSTDNVTFTDISGATSATFTTPVLTQTTYFRARTTCNTTVATSNVVTITVSNPQVTGTNTPVAICEGSTATLTATAATGSTIRFFDAATGGTALATGTSFTTPALTASRQYFVEAVASTQEDVGAAAYTSTGQTPQTGGALYFTATTPTTIASVTVYLNAGQAAGTVTIDLRTGSSTSGAIVSGQTTAFAVPAGPTTGVAPYVIPLNYTVPAAGAYTLHLSAASQSGLLRDNAGANLTGYPYTSPGGTISITGPSVAGFYYYFYNWQIGSSCAGTRTPIQVNVTPAPTATLPATAASCGTSAYSLTGTIGGSATTGTYTSTGTGTFSPDATTLNATYTPSAADVTAGSVTITLTAAGPAGTTCAAGTAQTVLTINPATTATFSYAAASYCQGATTNPTPTVTGTAGGSFSSTAGLTLDATTGAINLATSTPGTYTVTYSVSGPCPSSATATVTVTAPATATFSYASSTLCVSGTAATPTITGTTGGTFASTTGLTINATTGAITPATSTPGTYTVTYSVGGNCPASATATVTITTAPVATFSYGSASYCVSGTTPATPVFATGASAGTFSSTAGLSLNASTGTLTPATSTPGTYTVTNTIATAGGCAATTATFTVTITAAPVATFTYANAAYCVGTTGTAAPVLGTGATAGTFTASGTGLVISSAGVINLSTSTAGTYTVTNTIAAAGGCAATTATFAVTINARPAQPTFTPTYNGATTTLTSSSPTGNQWYLGGVAIVGATGPTYVVNSAAQFGSYTVVVTDPATGCSSLPSLPLIVNSSVKPLAGSALSVFPNPTADGNVTVELKGYTKATELNVYNAVGQLVLSTSVSGKSGVQTAPLDMRQLPAGVYILRARTEGGLDVRRITKE
ncbi:T9SS type A sorting domain-containing protein [Hymenobacter sp. BT186]|uniref:T9SS type A sorting domain-containing protein n=1 Tax=Hymenobacter telluris TaxID=2816474 RepID=A0A939EW18_9BACT|nr:T9SS type A sorting domain-containing protein [Hymenobacter telluris]MBO0358234.1 T9SS type A sorting domain-containing protein [Hymenobacter telluris]MBW3374260.1 T9SS type A sorting domain-containing protein [Hymenobacter norwichensis]